MELKAVDEYKAPEYSTCEESKNKVLRLMMNCKKVSLGVLAMFLLCSNAMADIPLSSFTEYSGPMVSVEIPITFKIMSLLIYYLEFVGISSIIGIIYATVSIIKIKKSEDANNKKKIRKRIIIALAITFLLPVLILGGMALIMYLFT